MKFLRIIPVLILMASFTLFFGCDEDVPENLNTQVIWLGDSIFALSGNIADYLEELSGERYREYYASGADMTVGATGVPTIREQYEEAMAEDSNVRTILMDGGGNDILISNSSTCSSDWVKDDNATMEEAGATLSPECLDLVDQITDSFEDMAYEGASKGIKKALYLCVYYLGSGWDHLDAVTKYGWDMAHLLIQDLNRNLGSEDMRYVFVDPRPYISRNSGYISIDGIHPTSNGSKVIANLMWEAMVDNCVEQDASCVPVPIDDGL